MVSEAATTARHERLLQKQTQIDATCTSLQSLLWICNIVARKTFVAGMGASPRGGCTFVDWHGQAVLLVRLLLYILFRDHRKEFLRMNFAISEPFLLRSEHFLVVAGRRIQRNKKLLWDSRITLIEAQDEDGGR